MSYILDALKKSDQQRQRSAAPTLPAAQVAVAAKQYYGVLTVLVLGCGIAIGWLRPWMAEPSVHQAEPIAASAPIQVSSLAAPLHEFPDISGKTALPSSTPVVKTAPKADVAQPYAPVMTVATVSVPENPAGRADVAQRVIPVTELPLSIQQEIPAMTIQFHSYSSIPASRLVGINSQMLHEGESLTPGLKLEQITTEGVIFSYKGYRFQRGIR